METYPSAASEDIWLGFDRAVVPDAETARQGDMLRKSLRDQILSHPSVQGLPPAQKSILEIGLARLLENNLDVQRVGPNKWEAVLTLPNGSEVRGDDILPVLKDLAPFKEPIKNAFQTAFSTLAASLGTTLGTIAPSGEHSTALAEPRDAHMRALIVFDEEPLLQNREARYSSDGYAIITRENFPKESDVRQKCDSLGIRINGKKVPIIHWKVAEICSDYDVLFGLEQFGTKSKFAAKRPISETRSKF